VVCLLSALRFDELTTQPPLEVRLAIPNKARAPSLDRLAQRGEGRAAGLQPKTKIGCEVPFNRHFYVFEPPRPLSAIDADPKRVTDRIRR
jgi:hypothetical protein